MQSNVDCQLMTYNKANNNSYYQRLYCSCNVIVNGRLIRRLITNSYHQRHLELCNVIVNGRLIRRLIIIRNIRGSIALQCDCQRKTYKKANHNS